MLRVEVNVDPRLTAFLRAGATRRLMLQDAIDDIADVATAEQRIYAPRGETRRLFNSIHQTGIGYRPGGPGGGGTYEIKTGVLRGIAPHAEDVLFGTAMDAPGSTLGTPGRIYPTHAMTAGRFRYGSFRARLPYEGIEYDDPKQGLRGTQLGQARPALTFQKKGEPRKWRAWVSGQRPNNFVYTAFIGASIYAEGRIRTIDIGTLG
jgi:hypothetical protein